jgi:putative transposase
LSIICSYFKKTRQGYYKAVKRKIRDQEKEKIVLEKVRTIRSKLPNIGTLKLKSNIERDENVSFRVSRDWLFSFLRERGLLIKKKKRYARTTNSNHHFKVYKNEIKDLPSDYKGNVLVSDITYLPTLQGFVYLFLVTDLRSRNILGYSLRNNLQIEGSIEALEMAINCLSKKRKGKVIHHSDRGMQYCGREYIEILKRNKIKVSMTEENHCYENAVAERVNGILKEELIGNNLLPNFELAQNLVINSVKLYNSKRIHQSLGYLTPDEVFFNKKPVNLF